MSKDKFLRRARLRLLALITVVATAVISFSSVQHLAAMAHFGWLSWLFPVTLDAVAAFGMDVWMRRSRAQTSAGTLALSAIGLSLGANVADHFLATNMVLAAVLGAIPPIMLAWLLLVLHRHGMPEVVRDIATVVTGSLPDAREEPDRSAPMTPQGPTTSRYRSPAPAAPVATTPIGTGTEYRTGDRTPVPAPDTVPVPPEPVPTDSGTGPVGARTVDWGGTGPRMPVNGRHQDRVAPRPVPPETDAEKTTVMAPIGTKVEQPGESRTKASPAARTRGLVSVPVPGLDAGASNEDLAAEVARRGGMSRRAVMREFGVGTGRATTIINKAEEVA